MLLEFAIADAYGAGFEFTSRTKIDRFNTAVGYPPSNQGIPPGHYTDDTQMSLAIAELVIEGKPWTRINIADKFVHCFRRNMRIGYAKGFYHFLHSVDNGTDFLKRITPVSTRNGAAMRAVPIGVVESEAQVMEMACIQASITHNTTMGIKSSQAMALAAHYFIYNKGPKSLVCDYLSDVTHYPWKNDRTGTVRCCGKETVEAVLTVLDRCSDLRDALIQSVEFGGDVDTVAALAVSIASLSNEFKHNLPVALFKNLENGKYGHQYLKDMDAKLQNRLKISA